MRRRTFLDLLVAGVAAYAVRPSIAVTAQPVTWHERLPKVELHLHFEGAIPKATLWELITKYGGDRAIKTRGDLERALVYRDFGGFLKMWVWMIGYLREYDDYTLIGEAVARDLARQKVRPKANGPWCARRTIFSSCIACVGDRNAVRQFACAATRAWQRPASA